MKLRVLSVLLPALLCSGCLAVPYYYDGSAPYYNEPTPYYSSYNSYRPYYRYSPYTSYRGPYAYYGAPAWPYAYARPSFSSSYWSRGHSYYRGHYHPWYRTRWR